MRISILSIVFFMMAFSSIFSQDKTYSFQNKKALVVPVAKFEPNIDGKLSDEIWNLTQTIVLTHMNGTIGSPYDQTKVKITSSKTNIFVSFYCEVPKDKELIIKAQNPDDDMKNDDAVHLLISPGIETLSKSYLISVNGKNVVTDSFTTYIVSVNGKGVVSDAANKEWNWEGITTAVSKGDGFWSVEMSLPIKEFEKDHKKLKLKGWRLNLYRIRPEKGWDDLTEASWMNISGNNPFDGEQAGYMFLDAINEKLPEGALAITIPNEVDVLYLGLVSAQISKLTKDDFLIDGDIREQINVGATPIAFKKLDNKPDPTTGKVIPYKNRTEGWLCTVKDTLVVSVRCYESSMDRLVSSEKIRDSGNTWADDSVELFIGIGPEESKSYYHIAVNAHGSIYDSYEGNVAWNGNNIKAGTVRKEGYWDVEIQIPFEDLDVAKVKAALGQPWRFNIVRHRPIHKAPEELEEAAWSPTGTTKSHEPSKFGYIFMDSMNAKPK